MRGAIVSTIVVAAFVWVIGTGFWLMSGTEYPYLRTVGGAVLICAGIWGALVTIVLCLGEEE